MAMPGRRQVQSYSVTLLPCPCLLASFQVCQLRKQFCQLQLAVVGGRRGEGLQFLAGKALDSGGDTPPYLHSF